jgi:hypothetical protein
MNTGLAESLERNNENLAKLEEESKRIIEENINTNPRVNISISQDINQNFDGYKAKAEGNEDGITVYDKTDANGVKRGIYEIVVSKTGKLDVFMNAKEIEEFAIFASKGLFEYVFSLAFKANKSDFDKLWDETFPPNAGGCRLFMPTQNIVTLKEARFFYTMGDTVANRKLSKISLPSELEDVGKIGIDKLNVLGSERFIDHRTVVTGYIEYLFKNFDDINDYLYGIINSQFSKERFNTFMATTFTQLNKGLYLQYYNYILDKSLTFPQICAFFGLETRSVISLFVNKYYLNPVNVFQSFYGRFNIKPEDLTSYALENIPTLLKYMNIQYEDDFIIDKVEIALFCYMYAVNKTGLYVILGFMRQMKHYMGNEIYFNDTDYNKLNIGRQLIANSRYVQKAEVYKTVADEKFRYNISSNSLITQAVKLKQRELSSTPLNQRSIVLTEKRLPETRAAYNMVDEIILSDSYILDVQKQKERLIGEQIKYEKVLADVIDKKPAKKQGMFSFLFN